jgi:hypothetical protein
VLKKLGFEGRTTQGIAKAGNIREDMFRLLVTADLVIADISIHNANVFYELGIRHALRAELLRSEASWVRGRFDRLRRGAAPPHPDSFAPLTLRSESDLSPHGGERWSKRHCLAMILVMSKFSAGRHGRNVAKSKWAGSTSRSATALPTRSSDGMASIESSFCTSSGTTSGQPSARRPSAVSSAL